MWFEPCTRIEKSAYFTGSRCWEYCRWRSTGRLMTVPLTEPVTVRWRAGAVLSRAFSCRGTQQSFPVAGIEAARIHPRQNRTRSQAVFMRYGLEAGAQLSRAVDAAASTGAASQGADATPRPNDIPASSPPRVFLSRGCDRGLAGRGRSAGSGRAEMAGYIWDGVSRRYFQKRRRGDYGGGSTGPQGIILSP